MAKVKQICEEKIGPIIEELGYELLDVSYEKENGAMSLIFTIDNEAGVSITDCEIVTRKIDPIIEQLNPTDDKPYTLVVSSPGIDRVLKTDRDLKRTIDKEVDLNLFAKIEGKKAFRGILKSFDENSVVLETEKETLTFVRNKIASIKLVIKF